MRRVGMCVLACMCVVHMNVLCVWCVQACVHMQVCCVQVAYVVYIRVYKCAYEYEPMWHMCICCVNLYVCVTVLRMQMCHVCGDCVWCVHVCVVWPLQMTGGATHPPGPRGWAGQRTQEDQLPRLP